MDNIERSIGRLEGKVESISLLLESIDKKVDNLPCASHKIMLEALGKWQNDFNGEVRLYSSEKYKGTISLKNSVIISCLTFILGVLTALITHLFFM